VQARATATGTLMAIEGLPEIRVNLVR